MNAIKNPPPKKLLNIREVAALLGLSVRGTLNYVDAGKLPRPVKLGRSARWIPDEIDAAIATLAKQR